MYLVEVIPATKIPLSQPQIFTYYTSLNIERGSLAVVPIHKRLAEGIVIDSRNLEKEKISVKQLGYELKSLKGVLENGHFFSDWQIEAVKWMADYYAIPLGLALKVFMPKRPKKGGSVKAIAGGLSEIESAVNSIELPPELAAGLDRLSNASRPVLVHNKNNADLTDLHALLLAKTIKNGKQALILEPEINLAKNLFHALQKYFKEYAVFLSKDQPIKKYWETWQMIKTGQAKIVVGTRSAVFAPMKDPGLVIIKNEHSSSYKNWDQQPRYQAKTLAMKLASDSGAKLILESAAPSVESYYGAVRGKFELMEIGSSGSPIGGSAELPLVVNMREELRGGNFSIISEKLRMELAATLEKKEKALLFMNRRGLATAVVCRDCGAIIKCPACDAPMVYHELGQKRARLICHYCELEKDMPLLCPKCQSHRIKYIGTGTQKVVDAVKALFPEARIRRLDSDAVRFGEISLESDPLFKNADILVGTQMVVGEGRREKFSLVGIVNADTVLHLPDFRAGEITFQLIYQLSSLAEKTVIQTYAPENYIIGSLQKKDYAGFFSKEIADREALSYPPFSSLVRLYYSHKDSFQAKKEAKLLVSALLAIRNKHPQKNSAELLGPAPAYVYRVKNRYQWQIIIKLKNSGVGIKHDLLSAVPSGWLIDVDPISLL